MLNSDTTNDKKSICVIFKNKKIINDIILAFAIIIICLIVLLIFKLNSKVGNYAVVSVDGKYYSSYPLNKDIEVELTTGKDKDHINVLVIKDGKVFVKDADCRDGICVNHYPINEVGETIICLPNRMIIEIQEEN